MRQFLLSIILVFSTLGLSSTAKAEEISADNMALLKMLDEAVENKDLYQETRKQRADSFRMEAHRKTGYDRIIDLQQSYETFNRFLTDSVFEVLNEIKQCPEYETDRNLKLWVALSEARNYGVMGLYSTAFMILDQFDPTNYNRDIKLHYYNTKHAISGWLADFATKSAPEMAKDLKKEATQYYDSILALEENPFSRTLIRCNILFENGEYRTCIDTLLAEQERCHPGARIYLYALLADSYMNIGDIENSIKYLALTSIHDLEEGVTEYMALPILAEYMNDLGDNERAYSYMICSLDDANTCHSSLRTIEAASIFPIIEASRSETEEMKKIYQRNLYVWGTIVILLILICICFYFYEHHRRMVLLLDQEKKHVKDITFLAEHDELTSVFNRRGGKRIICKALEKHCAGYLCTLDIDLFKHVNDTYGHDVGDKVLNIVAKQLMCLDNHIIVRMGGDEFSTYCMSKISKDEYIKQIEKMFDSIKAVRLPEMGDNEISVSVGAVFYDGSKDISFDQLFTEADKRLYMSKQVKGCALTIL